MTCLYRKNKNGGMHVSHGPRCSKCKDAAASEHLTVLVDGRAYWCGNVCKADSANLKTGNRRVEIGPIEVTV